MSTIRRCQLLSLPTMAYADAWTLQQSWVKDKLADPAQEDGLILVEHLPVYTLGTGSSEAFLKFSSDNPPVPLYRTERGGEVTYHCPGQLVGYPILDLRHFRQDLHWYLRQLEAVLIKTLAALGIKGERIPGLTGVWVNEAKVAAIAIKVTRWISFHGFALNINPDLQGFAEIVPCGIGDRPVGSLAQVCPTVNRQQVEPLLLQAFAATFDVDWQRISLEQRQH